MPNLPDYLLKFDQFPDVQVTMGRLSIDELFAFNEILAMPRDDEPKLRAYLEALAAFVGKHMVEWNLTDRRERPVALGRVTDPQLLGAIRDGWLQGINGGRAPLDPSPAQEADLADLMQAPGEPAPEPSDSVPEPAS